jgi:hypothetical protein
MPFYCSICEEESALICVRCTKDTCGNHLCARCRRCSDCCECEVALEDKKLAPRPEAAPVPPESADVEFEDNGEPEDAADPEPPEASADADAEAEPEAE